MNTELIIPIIAMVPALLAPLIAWFLSQRGVSRRAKELESLLTRIELVEKLRQIQEQTSDSKARLVGILDTEVGDILDDLESLREIQAPLITKPYQKMAGLRRFLLLYKQASRKGKVYRGVFYACFFIAVSGGVVGVAEGMSRGTGGDWIFGLVGAAFYLAIGLAFRAAAVRDYEKKTKKTKVATSS